MGNLEFRWDIRCTYAHNKCLTCQYPLQINRLTVCLYVRVDAVCPCQQFFSHVETIFWVLRVQAIG